MLVFIDDSGDPGFKLDRGSSSHFVINCIIFDDNLEAEKTSLAIKELRRSLKTGDEYEFKFNKTSPRFKKAFFEAICAFNFRVRAIVVDKNVIHSTRFRSFKENFYNYIIMQVLKQSKGHIKNAKLKFDKRGEKALRDELRVYLSRELDNKTNHIFSELKFVDSRQNTLIQLADMVAGCIASFSKNKKDDYYKLLKKCGRLEDIWDFK
jgi:hypothetical protein